MTSISVQQASSLIQGLVGYGGWRRENDRVLEAMPHLAQSVHPDDILTALENLKVCFSMIQCREDEISSTECPALVICNHGECYIALDRTDEGLLVQHSGDTAQRVRIPGRRNCQVAVVERFHHKSGKDKPVTVGEIFSVLNGMMPWLLVCSLLANLLGLFAPLLIMVIYDRVIPSGSIQLLVSLVFGVLIVLGADFCFRMARAKTLAYVGQKAERQLTVTLFQKLMSLPLSQLQKSGLEQQLARFRQFESLRELFTGSVMTSLLDLPFVLIFLGVLFYIAPPIGILTVFAAIVFVVLTLLSFSKQERLNKAAQEATASHRIIVHDAVRHQRTLVNLGMVKMWTGRAEMMAENSESAGKNARQFQSTMQSLAQTITVFATVGAILLSAYSAMAGSMSFGALIAVIALVSKVLAPIHALHSNMPQILSFRQSISQADRVMALPVEVELGLQQSHQRTLSGDIRLSTVTHRPDPAYPPVLSQVSFHVEPNELVFITGSGVGARTAVLDLMVGLHQPLAGIIEHEGIDIRQIPRDELRRSINYGTFKPGLLYGSIAQNFQLAHPSISVEQIESALSDIGLDSYVQSLPEGLETRLTEDTLANMPESILKSLSIARNIARPAAVRLFSEPTSGLDSEQREYFKAWLTKQRGSQTIVIATADRSLMRLADRFVFLDEGRVVVNDKGGAGLKKITAALHKHEG